VRQHKPGSRGPAADRALGNDPFAGGQLSGPEDAAQLGITGKCPAVVVDDAPWIDGQRQQLQQIRLRALQAYATAALGISGTELPAAERASRQLIALAPLRENGYQILMRALACQGNAAEALRVYAALCDLLRDELGVAPCATTQAVHAELTQAS
jgi:DNA-binding SARP family transcriptional activator